jgi:outer membrane lipoprotein-sorting protein
MRHFRYVILALLLISTTAAHAQNDPEEYLKKATERLSNLKTYQCVFEISMQSPKGKLVALVNFAVKRGRTPRYSFEISPEKGSTGEFDVLATGEWATMIFDGKRKHLILRSHTDISSVLTKSDAKPIADFSPALGLLNTEKRKNKTLLLLREEVLEGVRVRPIAVFAEGAANSFSALSAVLDESNLSALKEIKDLDLTVFYIESKTNRLLRVVNVFSDEGEVMLVKANFKQESINAKLPDSLFELPKGTFTAKSPSPSSSLLMQMASGFVPSKP